MIRLEFELLPLPTQDN